MLQGSGELASSCEDEEDTTSLVALLTEGLSGFLSCWLCWLCWLALMLAWGVLGGVAGTSCLVLQLRACKGAVTRRYALGLLVWHGLNKAIGTWQNVRLEGFKAGFWAASCMR